VICGNAAQGLRVREQRLTTNRGENLSALGTASLQTKYEVTIGTIRADGRDGRGINHLYINVKGLTVAFRRFYKNKRSSLGIVREFMA
jgi:hypothetical protein